MVCEHCEAKYNKEVKAQTKVAKDFHRHGPAPRRDVLSRLTAYYAASLPVGLRHPFPAPEDARDVAFDDACCR